MHRPGFLALGILFLLLAPHSRSTPPSSPAQVAFLDLPDTAHQGIPFPLRLEARRPDGTLDTSVDVEWLLLAHQVPSRLIVISEISQQQGAVEFTNTGTEPVDVGGWEMECLDANPISPLSHTQRIPSPRIVPPGTCFVWTSSLDAPDAWPYIRSTRSLYRALWEPSTLRIRDAQGRLVDVIGNGYDPEDPQEFTGTAITHHRGLYNTPSSLVRIGSENQFSNADWRLLPPSIGTLNPELIVPWTQVRIPITCEPRRVVLSQGVWSGTVTLIGTNDPASLTLALPDGRLLDSQPFLLQQPQLPNSILLRLLNPSPLVSESDPGAHLQAELTLSPSLTEPLPVTLHSSSIREFLVPEHLLLVPGEPLRFAITNLDDSIADGRAVVTITASAPGHEPATLTVFNEDNEIGKLHLELPPVAVEGTGRHIYPGRVFLPQVQPHPVLVHLTSDPALEVPPTLLIPAGQGQALFTLHVADDFTVNAPQRRASVHASTASWPASTASLELQDDDPATYTFHWPQEVLEGVPARGMLILDFPRDYPERLRFTGGNSRLPRPDDILIPPGSTVVEWFLNPPDTPFLDDPMWVQICLYFARNYQECSRVYVADDEFNVVGVHTPFPPKAVWSGTPFSLPLYLVTQGLAPRSASISASLTVVPPAPVQMVAPAQPILFQGDQFTEPVTLLGQALGVQLDALLPNASARSAPFDVLHGYERPGPMYDVAVLPTSGHLLLSTPAPNPNLGLLLELDPATGSVLRQLELPRPAIRIAVSDDGSTAWLASSSNALMRVDLSRWRFGLQFSLESPDSPASTVLALTILPATTDFILVLLDPPGLPQHGPENGTLVAFDRGQRLSNVAVFPIHENYSSVLLPGRQPGEAYLRTLGELARLSVTPQGVDAVTRTNFFGNGQDEPNLSLTDQYLLAGTGLFLNPDTLEPLFAPSLAHQIPLQMVVPLPDASALAYIDTAQGFHLIDTTSFDTLGTHQIPAATPHQLAARFLRCGPNRFAALSMDGASLRIWDSPIVLPQPADLALLLDGPPIVPRTPFGELHWSITITNRGPGSAVLTTLSSQGYANSWHVGSLAPGGTWTFDLPYASHASGWINDQVEIHSYTPDPQPSNNVARLESAVLTPAPPSVHVLPLHLEDLATDASGQQLLVAVSKTQSHPDGAVLVINPTTAQVEQSLPIHHPRRLAVDSTGSFLHVQSSSNTVVRWNFTTETLDPHWLPQDPSPAILGLTALPSHPSLCAVVTRRFLSIIDGPNLLWSVTLSPANDRQVTFTADQLWVASPGRLRRYQLTPDGPQSAGSDFLLQTGPLVGSDARRLYFSDALFDLASLSLTSGPTGPDVLPAIPLDILLLAHGRTLYSYRHSNLDLIDTETLPADVPEGGDIRWARWAEDGLAAADLNIDQLILFRSTSLKTSSADLALNVEVSDPPGPFSDFTALLVITNLSPSPASWVRLQTTFASTIENLAIEPTPPFEFSGTYHHEWPSIPGHGSLQVAVTGTLNFDQLNLQAQISSGALDPNLTNNQVRLDGPLGFVYTDIAITSWSVPQQVVVGQTFEAVAHITNAGRATAESVLLSFPGSFGLEIVQATRNPARPECCPPASPISIGPLHPGESAEVHFLLKFHEAGWQLFTLHLDQTLIDGHYPDNEVTRGLYVAPLPSPTPTNPSGLRLSHLIELTWNYPRQQLFGNVASHLVQMDPLTLEPIRRWSIPNLSRGRLFDPTGRYLWTVTTDNSIVRLDLDTGTQTPAFPMAEGGSVTLLPQHPDVILSAGYNPSRGASMTAYNVNGTASSSLPLNWNGSGNYSVQANREGRIFVFDTYDLIEFAYENQALRHVRTHPSVNTQGMHGFYLTDRLAIGNWVTLDIDTGIIQPLPIRMGVTAFNPILPSLYSASIYTDDLQRPQLVLEGWDTSSPLPLWRQSRPFFSASLNGMVPCEPLGVMVFNEARQIHWFPQPTNTSIALDLRAEMPAKPLGVGQELPLHLELEGLHGRIPHDTLLHLTLSPGLRWLHPSAPESSAPWELPFITLFEHPFHIASTNLTLVAVEPGSQWVEIRATAHSPPSDTAEITRRIEIMVPDTPRLLLADTYLLEGYPLTLRLDRPTPIPLLFTVSVEHLTTQPEDVFSSVIEVEVPAGSHQGLAWIVVGDGLPEPDEQLRLTFLQGPVVPTANSMVLTLGDIDRPSINIPNLSVPEGNQGPHTILVPMHLNVAMDAPFAFTAHLLANSATAGEDFQASPARRFFAPGQTTHHLPVVVIGDTVRERAESFLISLSHMSMDRITPTQGRVTLINDDPILPPPIAMHQLPNGDMTIRFTSQADTRYRLAASTNLTTGSFQLFLPMLPGDGSILSFPVPTNTLPFRFFRVYAY